MLDDLRRLRGLQARQRQALIDRDGDLLDALDAERMALQTGLRRPAEAGLSGADLAEAEALVRAITDDQLTLIAMAERARDELAAELRGLTPGRAALAGYRAPTATSSVCVDRAG